MSGIFAAVLNMSLTASVIIALVLLARYCLRKAPKIYSYLLWSVVLFRLLCPFSVAVPFSVLSLFSSASTAAEAAYTSSMQYIAPSSERQEVPAAVQNINPEPVSAESESSAEYDSSEPNIPEHEIPFAPKRSAGEIVLTVFGWLWIAGVAVFVGFTTLQYIHLSRELEFACLLRGNIYESDSIMTAFVLGVFNPKIYLPYGLDFDVQKAVIAHEQTHQRRGDHIVKILAYTALAIHWFNPLVWLAFRLSCDDMEKSCDEAVLLNMSRRGYEERSTKAAYGQMLFALGSGQRTLFSPVSFAETGIKGRVKNVLDYQRLTKTAATVVSAAVVILLTACVMNPVAEKAVMSGSWKNYDPGKVICIGDDYFFENSETVELHCLSLMSYDISPITACRNLKSLSIFGVTGTDYELLPELDALQSLPELESVSIYRCHLDDAELDVLAGCRGLKNLMLYNCMISDLTQLNKLTGVETLDIREAASAMDFDGEYTTDHLSHTEKDIFSALSLPNLRELKISVPFTYDQSENRFYISSDTVEAINSFCGENKIEKLCVEITKPNMTWEEEDNSTGREMTYDYSLLADAGCISGLEILYSDADLSFIASLPSLRSLSISELTHEQASTKEFHDIFSSLDKLETLSLNIDPSPAEFEGLTGFTDISFLANLKELRRLDITANSDDFSFLKKLRSLVSLYVGRTYSANIPEIDIAWLSGCKKLEYLDIQARVSGFERLAKIKSLQTLYLHNDRVFGNNSLPDSYDINKLVGLDDLRLLELSAEHFDGVSALTELPRLESAVLHCESCGNLEKETAEFDEKLPYCRVEIGEYNESVLSAEYFFLNDFQNDSLPQEESPEVPDLFDKETLNSGLVHEYVKLDNPDGPYYITSFDASLLRGDKCPESLAECSEVSVDMAHPEDFDIIRNIDLTNTDYLSVTFDRDYLSKRYNTDKANVELSEKDRKHVDGIIKEINNRYSEDYDGEVIVHPLISYNYNDSGDRAYLNNIYVHDVSTEKVQMGLISDDPPVYYMANYIWFDAQFLKESDCPEKFDFDIVGIIGLRPSDFRLLLDHDFSAVQQVDIQYDDSYSDKAALDSFRKVFNEAFPDTEIYYSYG